MYADFVHELQSQYRSDIQYPFRKEGSFARTDQSILRVFDIMVSETMIQNINKGINVPKKEER